MGEFYRFAAFISYSSKDAAFARRLHRALESYSIPVQLGTFDLLGGGKKNRIFPVFRDHEELPSGELGAAIHGALKASNALVVVCSRNAARSPWVNKEIETFLSFGRRDRIFAIIAEDAPLVDEGGADSTFACFPPALRGESLQGGFEPLAADTRKGKASFRAAWLKVVAGLINVNAGALTDRDAQQRRAQRRRLGLLGIGLVSAAALTFAAVDARNWRTRLSTYAESVTSQERWLDALPFAVAGVNGSRMLLTGRSDRADDALMQVGAIRVAANLGKVSYFDLADEALVTVGEDGLGTLYDPRNPERRTNLGDLYETRRFLSDDGAALVTLGRDGRGMRYDLRSFGKKRELGYFEALFDYQLSPDGAFLLGGDGSRFTLYDLNDPPNAIGLGPLAFHHFSADSTVLLTVGRDSKAWLHNLKRGNEKIDLGKIENYALNGSVLVFQRSDFSLTLYDLKVWGKKVDLGYLGGISDFQLSADGSTLFVLSESQRGMVYDVGSATLKADLGNLGSLERSRLTSDGLFLVTSGEDFRGTLHTLTNPPSRFDLGSLRDFRVSDDGRILFAQDEEFLWTRRDLRSEGQMISYHDLGPLSDYQLSADGSILLAMRDRQLTIYDLNNESRQTQLGKLWYPSFQSYQLSADGGALVAQGADERGTLYDLRTPVWAENRRQRKGASLVAAVCAASGDAMRPFPASMRDKYEGFEGGDRFNPEIYATLRGRPWNPCDWRGIATIFPNVNSGDSWFEGPRQWLRLISVRYGGARDFACAEGTFGTMEADEKNTAAAARREARKTNCAL